MKTVRTFLLIVLAVSVGFLAVRWSVAQSGENPLKAKAITGASNPALERLNALVSYLQASKETNALKLFDDYSNASIAQRNSADIGVTLRTLLALREGRTNEAIESLERKLDIEIIEFAASFKELPETHREWLGLHSLTNADWYRSKFSHNHPYKNVDDGVTQAFELLNKKNVR